MEGNTLETNIHSVIIRVLGHSTDSNSLVGAIAEWIGRAIIEDRLRPGDDLNSVDLSKQFNTSRTPVREALLILEKEGLVTISPRRRPYVTQISLKEVREIYQIRANLYSLVAELIVATASDDAIASLRAFLPQLREAEADQDIEKVFWLSIAFRDTEADICGNSQVKRILDSLGLRTLQLRHLSIMQVPILKDRFADRERLVCAYEERDAPLAIALTRGMVLRSFTIIERSGWVGFQTEKHDQVA